MPVTPTTEPGKPESIADIVAGIRGIADSMESAAKKFDAEHAKDVRCSKHPHCFRHDDLMREVEYWRELADRIEAAAERERAIANALREALVEILNRTNREKARNPYAAIVGGILEIHDIANTALNQTKGE